MAICLPSYTLQGLRPRPVQIEVEVGPGMPIFSIIGMAGTSVQEAKDRIRSALTHSGFPFPLTRKVVNLAPAELPKTGSHYDLSMALGFLMAGKEIPRREALWAIGELGLNGEVRRVRGVLPALLFAVSQGVKELILPYENREEARLVSGLKFIFVRSLLEAVHYLKTGEIPAEDDFNETLSSHKEGPPKNSFRLDFADIAGHAGAKRALLVAGAGAHHIVLKGPPGSGKSLLAQSFPSLLPPLNDEEFLEVLALHSLNEKQNLSFSRDRPFRTIHPRSTPYLVFGGGTTLQAGEVSLAHRGVLFMDEMPEFRREILEGLRGPLEGRTLDLRYGKASCEYPCRFQLLAARNPCPCGYLGDPERMCSCTAHELQRYQRKISGPILDRIDLSVSVPRLDFDEFKEPKQISSSQLRNQVLEARERQAHRLRVHGLFTNQELPPSLIRSERLDSSIDELLRQAASHYQLSGRALDRILKVSRTIADLEKSEAIAKEHVLEALQYRVG